MDPATLSIHSAAPLYTMSIQGRLSELLLVLPRARWPERAPDGETLLHYAARGDNVAAAVALLQSGLIDVNAARFDTGTASHIAAMNGQHRAGDTVCGGCEPRRLELRWHARSRVVPKPQMFSCAGGQRGAAVRSAHGGSNLHHTRAAGL